MFICSPTFLKYSFSTSEFDTPLQDVRDTLPQLVFHFEKSTMLVLNRG